MNTHTDLDVAAVMQQIGDAAKTLPPNLPAPVPNVNTPR